MNLILIGYRGTGKSSIGKLVAVKLGMEFVDVDDYIEAQEGKTIKDIFDQGGEELFRNIETRAIKTLCEKDGIVISPGGGAILRDENSSCLKRNGFAILLEATADVIHSRLNQDANRAGQRPNLTDKSPIDEIKSLLAARKPYYTKNADYTIDTSTKTIEQISNEAVEALKDRKNL